MSPRPFLFGEDFRGVPSRDDGAERAAEAERAMALATAEAIGFARGLEQGGRDADQDASRRLVAALEAVASGIPAALAATAAREAAAEADGLLFFEALARALAGRALAADPLGPIADAAGEAFRHLRGVPHLAVRVSPDLVEAVEERLRAMARERGFDGRLIVLGADEIAPGDARLEWAEGGVVRDRHALDAAVSSVLARAPLSAPRASP